MNKKPLFGMTFFMLIAIVLIATVPLTLFNVKNFKDFFYGETEDYLLESCAVLKNLYPKSTEGDAQKTAAEFALRASADTTLRVTIISEDGSVIADSHSDTESMNNHSDRPEIIGALASGSGAAVRNSATMTYPMMYAAVRMDLPGGTRILRTARSLSDVEASIENINKSALLISVIMLTAAGWASFILAGNVSRLLNKISTTSRHYASGNFDEKCSIVRPGVIAGIADDLNLMGKQLKDRFDTIETQKNELHLMLNNMSEAVIFTDHNMKVIRMNGAAEKLFDIRENNQQGRSILEIFMNSRLNDFAERLIAEGRPLVEEISLDLPKPVTLEISGTVLPDSAGAHMSSLLLVMHDITRNKQLEQMRKDFVANVSHELKTPVTLIKGYIETLLDSPPGAPDRTREFLEIMEKHSLRIEAIIEDLLTLSGIERGEIKELEREHIPAIDLITSAASSCGPAAEEKKISISIDCDESIIMRVYPLMAEQALVNLIDNAVKYSPEGTRIKIKAEASEDGRTCLSVKDQGCGISADEQARVFERFYRVDKARSRESGGTGLGLSIVRHIALSHNGTIRVESTPGKGSRFILCI